MNEDVAPVEGREQTWALKSEWASRFAFGEWAAARIYEASLSCDGEEQECPAGKDVTLATPQAIEEDM